MGGDGAGDGGGDSDGDGDGDWTGGEGFDPRSLAGGHGGGDRGGGGGGDAKACTRTSERLKRHMLLGKLFVHAVCITVTHSPPMIPPHAMRYGVINARVLS